ncbi:hypothetical protein PCASD_01181 [Puccinia coronata f. sp. avenae]|uniref:Uncharacterized protein n=1 Tax=Puccinia coronata f. sp. avenae TaxID=200324 RepID=A0A2N5VLR1_9BASI|nr:hypothetical protein PCASD_25033 [Puccinia coronata f. sp. avenae]PLW50943.1 hypothetical protein PCASD_01181 [Puccinia coronata f. sp. avenae]
MNYEKEYEIKGISAGHPAVRLGGQLVTQLSGSVGSWSPSCPARWATGHPAVRLGGQLVTQLSGLVSSWSPASCEQLVTQLLER